MPTHRCVVEEHPIEPGPDPRWVWAHWSDGTPVHAILLVTCLESGECSSGGVREPLTAERIHSVRRNLRNTCPARHVLGTL